MPDNRVLSEHYERFHRERGKGGTVAVGRRVGFIVERVGSGKRVLDLGCRYGDLALSYLEGNTLVGVDVDRAALDECSRRTGMEVHHQDLSERLRFDDASFDVAVLADVLEHLPYPDLILSEIRRVLRPGGTLVGSVPNGTRLRNRLSFLVTGDVGEDPTHLWYYGTGELVARLSRFFDDVEVEPTGGRFLRLWPRMMAKYILFAATKPATA
jgi:methionine biosynthesis protein MetW